MWACSIFMASFVSENSNASFYGSFRTYTYSTIWMDASFYGILKKIYLLLSYSLSFDKHTTSFYYGDFIKTTITFGAFLPWKVLLLYRTKKILTLPSNASFSQKNVIDFYDLDKYLIQRFLSWRALSYNPLFLPSPHDHVVSFVYTTLFFIVLYFSLNNLPKHTIFWNIRGSTSIILYPII
jgi:hypothetical protein